MKSDRNFRGQLGALVAMGLLASGLGVRADSLTNLWNLAPGDRPYLATDNSQRGVAYNRANGHVLVVSRTGASDIYVLNGDTGADIDTMNLEGVAGGTFAINMIGIADDGVVYAGNLSTSTTAPNYKLYRWENDNADTVPTVAFDGDPANGATNQRWGDSMDVRGAGTNTMVVIAARNTSLVAIFTTTDGMTFASTLVTNVGNATGSLGIAFGAGNTLWSKLNGQPLRHVSYDLATGQATLLHSFATTVFPGAICPIAVDTANNQLGGIAIETPDNFQLYEIKDLSNPPLFVDRKNLPTDNANVNVVGSVDFGPDRVYVLDSNNGVVAYKIERAVAPEPPTIDTQPQDQTVLEEGTATIRVTVKGTAPFSYQWLLNGVAIVNATNASYVIASVQLSQAGTYSVIISNVAGSVTSSNAVLTVTPLVRSDALTLLWKLAPGDRAYLTTDNSQRGLAFNPATTNVLLVSRSGGNNIHVLDGNTGAHLRSLNTDPTIVFGGTFVLNMVGVAADGVVYACNLTTSGSGFTIYRWDNDSAEAVPTLAYGPDNPGIVRCGDTFDVRGQGTNTQILVSSRNGKQVAIFTTADGLTFTATVIDTADATDGNFGLGVAFGAGNTFWGKSTGQSLRHAAFDLATGQGTTLHDFSVTNFPSPVSVVSVDPANNWLAAIAIEQPDNLQLYDISDLTKDPVLVEQRLFPTGNPNINGTGALDFSGNRLYALDSNNGILAFTVKKPTPKPPIQPVLSDPRLVAAGQFQCTLTGESGRAYVLETSADLVNWTPISTNIASSAIITITAPAATGVDYQFYRAAVEP